MPYGIDANGEEYAECPRCGLVAHGKAEIERLFGYRDMGVCANLNFGHWAQ